MDDQLVDRIFVRLGSIYGHLWSSRFRSEQILKATKAEWAMDLYGLHVNDIARGLEEMKRAYPDHPPTLPQFKALCSPVAAPYHRRNEEALALPAPRNAEVAQKHLADMRRMLGR